MKFQLVELENLNFTEENMDKNEKWLQWAVLFFLPF